MLWGRQDPHVPLEGRIRIRHRLEEACVFQMQVENKLVNLSPGMAVTVEIKTGSRTIISYLLSPLKAAPAAL